MIEPRADHGLTTLVFVDVERSTELLQRIGDDAGSASIGATLDVVRDHVAPYGGHEVKSLGDGLLLTFSSPRQAVSFSLVAQRALADSALRVRFGINTGEVLGPSVDPLGGAVNAAARIAARATGGEVLVSDVVRQLVGIVPSVRFVDRGRCRLKGFSERWHLWAVQDGAGEQRAFATIGRTEELALIAEAMSSTAAGRGQVTLVEGEAGIGKTHLVRDAVRRGRTTGLMVVEVASDEVLRRPGAIPHGLVEAGRGDRRTDALAELLSRATRSGESGDDLSYAVVEACVDIVEVMARTKPVVVVAEDLHWADDLSLAALVALGRRAGVSGFAVIGTLRPSPRPVILDRLLELVRGGLGRHLRLDSLDELDVQALASSITGAAPGPVLRERLRATAGNPLFVTELLRTIDDDGLLTIGGGVADVEPGAMPANLHETLVRRLSWLPHETNELLRLASLLGSAFTLHELAVITRRSVIDVAAALRDASLAGLIVGDGDRLTFRHDLIREAAYADMLPAVRRDLHRAAATALAEDGAPTQQVARQFALGALPGDLEAVGWLERAAVESISVSPSSALALLDEAIALAPPHWPGRSALQARMIEPLAWCGRFDDAEAIADDVLASSPGPDVEFAALRGLSSAHGNRGNTAAAIAALHRATSAPGAPPEEIRRLECLAAQLSVLTGAMTHDAGRLVMDAMLAAANEAEDATSQCLAHQSLSVLAAVTGHGQVAREHAAAALALFNSGRIAHASYLIPDTFHAVGLLELDEVEDAIVAADEARQRAERRGTLALLPMAYMAAAQRATTQAVGTTRSPRSKPAAPSPRRQAASTSSCTTRRWQR
ncbi:MAG: AAA family ATPase [Acidimicrobiia bacterium]